ncbi:MAG: hypothetical protein ACLR56_02565 [Oscillospiraceae bacterium]
MLCGRQFHRDLTEKRYAVTDITTMLLPANGFLQPRLGSGKIGSKYKFTGK